MSFAYRHRKFSSILALASLLIATTASPVAGEYDPKLGRWLQRDPIGTGVPLQPALAYHAANPTVSVSMARELQYGDGMNFYEFVRSNAVNHTDPSGLFSLIDFSSYNFIRAEFGLLSFAAAHPLATRLAGGLLAAANLYAFAQYEEVQAIVVAQPDPLGLLAAEAAALRLAVREVLRGGGSLVGVVRASSATQSAVSTSTAVIEAQYVSATGERHHVISTRIWRALEEHRVLRGRYSVRDSRFVTRAVSQAVHRGYQQWHRALDDEVVAWRQRNTAATQVAFEQFLRGIYDRPEMRARFPHGFEQ